MTTATLAILNGHVWIDGNAPAATAVAVADERIIAIGSDRQILSLTGPGTRTIDAAGGSVLPGFNDAHVHLEQSGGNLLGIDLRDARDEAEFSRRLSEYLRTQPKGCWICRGVWDHENWPSRRLPTRELLDAVSPDHPVFLARLDGHVAVANSLALTAAQVRKETPDPAGGKIGRAADGAPNGLFFDTALELVRRAIPRPTEMERLEAIETGLRHASQRGLTSLQAMCSLSEYELLQRLAQSGRLPVRIHAILPVEALEVGLPTSAGQCGTAALGCAEAARAAQPGAAVPHQQQTAEVLHTGAIKLFDDGSFGAATALLFEPYDDRPGSTGLAIYTQEQLDDLVRRIDAAGLQAAVHAIGDRGVDMALTAFGHTLAAGGRKNARHRIEHAQMVRPADRARFAAAGLIASLQPSHCIDDMRWIANRLGTRCDMAYPYRSLAAAGIPIALGTDWDVEPLDPMLTLYAAVTRESTTDGPAGGWFGEEKVTLQQALRDYTLGSAFAEFREGEEGTLEVGKLADIVILSRNIFDVPPSELLSTRPRTTIMGGRVVFEAAG